MRDHAPTPPKADLVTLAVNGYLDEQEEKESLDRKEQPSGIDEHRSFDRLAAAIAAGGELVDERGAADSQ